jgi:RecB family endonuclease NucS
MKNFNRELLKKKSLHDQVCSWLAIRHDQVAFLLNSKDFIPVVFELELHEGDFVDMIAYDKVIPYGGRKENDEKITCFVVEVKSDKGDHEMLGQLKKSVNAMKMRGSSTRLFDEVRGVAVADNYTPSGLKLLKDEGYDVIYWCQDDDMIGFSKRKVL